MSPRKRDGGDRLVWSDQGGGDRRAPAGEAPRSPRVRPRDARPGDGSAQLRREVKGRRGKTVTSIAGLPLDESGLRALAGELKRLCGTGGSAKDGVIEIQGDHRDALEAALRERGYAVKRTGG